MLRFFYTFLDLAEYQKRNYIILYYDLGSVMAFQHLEFLFKNIPLLSLFSQIDFYHSIAF